MVAKYAERLSDEATSIVHDTYLHLFEGVEGTLIEQDANLVEVLEKDFNVTLPQAISGNKTVNPHSFSSFQRPGYRAYSCPCGLERRARIPGLTPQINAKSLKVRVLSLSLQPVPRHRPASVPTH